MLYVANPPTQSGEVGSVLGFAGNADGNVSPTVRIAGKKTGLSYQAASIAIDKLGRLYTTGSDRNLGQVRIWRADSNGDAKPTASFSGLCGDFTSYPMVLAFDQFGHLWVACSAEGGASQLDEYPQLRGARRGMRHFFPFRRIGGPKTGVTSPTAIAFDSNGQVSVENADGLITTFAATEDGNTAPRSRLRGDKTQLDGQGGISYDSQGRLVACTNRKDEPRLLTFAPGAKGDVAPISTLSVAGCKGVAIDPQDNIYVTFASSITEYAAGASGSAQPLRVISGDLTTLSNASGITF